MRNSLLQLVFCLVLLVAGAAAESSLPRVLGVGWPVLLVFAQLVASRATGLVFTLFAVAAGAFEDALGGLPPAASASYFLAVAWAVARVGLPRAGAALTYPGYLLWLWVWTGASGGGIFGRLLASVPIGFVTACVAGLVFTWAERGAALDEPG